MADLSEIMTANPAKYQEELIKRLDALKRKETFCDVTVAVKGKEFKAHKVVLAAASPFFLSLWESNMVESNEQRIEIKLEEATASVFEDVLQFIYTGNVSVTEESCHKLIATADYLLLPGLKTLACRFMRDELTVQNCVFTYYFAEKYQCEQLKLACCEEICSNFTDVMETEDFLNLDMKQVMEWVSRDDIKVGAEEEVFMGIVKWVSHNKPERQASFFELLRQVRLISISKVFLRNTLVKQELVTTSNVCLNFVLESITDENTSLSKVPRKCLISQVEAIFVCGGRKALCYLPDINVWYQLANMSFEHRDHAVIQERDKVFIFSKQNFTDSLSYVVEYYVPSTNLWCSFQSGFEYNEQFCSVLAVSGYSPLYALTNNDSIPENTIYTFDIENNEWELRGEDEYRNRWGACAVSLGHYLYIIGGSYDDTTTRTGITKVERFDPNDDSFQEVAPMNKARHAAFGAAMNDKIYVAGGIRTRHRSGLLDSCEVYDPSTDEWHLIASLCEPRHSASMVCFNGALYVIGGVKFTDRELSVEVFDSETNEWREKSTIPVSQVESEEERNKQMDFRACAASVHQDVFLRPILP